MNDQVCSSKGHSRWILQSGAWRSSLLRGCRLLRRYDPMQQMVEGSANRTEPISTNGLFPYTNGPFRSSG